MREHHLKTRQPFYDEVKAGRKTFEYRLNDRGFQSGDVVHLWRYEPDPMKPTPHGPARVEECSRHNALGGPAVAGEVRRYNPEECPHWSERVSFRVGFVLSAGPGVPLGEYVVFSLLPLDGEV